MRSTMSPQQAIRCLVDDTILTRNIAEIESWVAQGALILVIPLYSMTASDCYLPLSALANLPQPWNDSTS